MFFPRSALGVGLAAVLSGCAGVQTPMAAPNSTAQDGATRPQAERDAGWMLAEAKNETLLYVSASPNQVFVYSLPRPKLVGELHFNADVAGLCSDKTGNVWVPLFDRATFEGKILEYKHGIRRRIAALTDNGYPSGCAVEAATGDLAVSNYCINYRGSTCLDSGDVVVYAGARGSGSTYEDVTMNAYGFCAYDGAGDLFVDGINYSGSFDLVELRRGRTAFQNVGISQSLSAPAGIQWHGRYLTIASGSTIYEFSISRAEATQVGTTPLNDTTDAVQFALQGNTAIVPGAQSDNVAFYRYPTGGTPGKTILLFRAISAALSPPR
jgi:hypothetical protein